VPAIRELTHLPVIVDPTHSTGRLSLIEPMSLAAVAAGADGLIIEVHHDPATALCDADQALEPGPFAGLMSRVRPLSSFMEGYR
jgi:3-deoxy-7-phosphoheptulonate synthase